MLRTLALLFALIAAGVVAPARLAATAACYPGAMLPAPCLTGTFQQFWEQNGSLPVFGFPITLAAPETNADTGERYLTQWFERYRFELHPQVDAVASRPGTGILLGRLGAERLQQLGRDWHTAPHAAGPQPGCLWFPQTAHNVCDQGFPYVGQGFKSYWQSHGLQQAAGAGSSYARGLALFGLPLTEPAMETNSSGDIVLTQWFERARFEWHPDKVDPFKVLLGRLGAELRGSATTPTPVAPLPPSPTTVVAPPQPTPGAGTATSPAACSQDAPAVANGAQVWVTDPTPPHTGIEIACGRLTLKDSPKVGVTATFGVHYPALDAFTNAVTDSNGEAAVSFPAGSITGTVPITVDLQFATGQTAQTTYMPK